MKHAASLVACAVALSVALAVGCGDDAPDRFIAAQDAGADTGLAADAGSDAPTEVDPTLGGPCNDDAQCDDTIACTFDACDKTLSRCRNTPDDTRCGDNVYCNGAERCVLRQGCVPGAVVTCQDESACTIDKCIEATRSCEHLERDADGDGDPDDHCVANRDCDDTDPTVNSKRQEICGNFKDDNCNGAIDETPCAVPENDRCETASKVTAPSTLHLTTVAAKLDHPTSCASSITGAQDIVIAIEVPADGPKDVFVQAAGANFGGAIAVALESVCGSSPSEIQCAAFGTRTARAIARSQAAGATIYAVITTTSEGAVDLKVDFRAPTTHPTNEGCDAPQPIALDTAVPFSIIDATKDLPTACLGGQTGELTYAFTLSQPRDVRVFSSTTSGESSPIVGLRPPVCTEESKKCGLGTAPLFVRSLAAGTYVLDVFAGSQIDGNLVVQTAPATQPADDESCATAPALEPNTTELVTLTNHERLIEESCSADRGMSTNAARKLTLQSTSDVLLLARYALNQSGSVSLTAPDCPKETNLVCGAGQTPAKASLRGVAAGEYRVVVGDQYGQSAELIALVRPTVPPVDVTSDKCEDAPTIPPTGGFFTGDTSGKTADYNTSCDAANQPVGTAKDQVLRLTLTQRKRVVFDTTGTLYNSLIDVRQGEPCPGIAAQDACDPSFIPGDAFLDRVLDAGTYWVVIDGYAGATGKWNLDVRVLDPAPVAP